MEFERALAVARDLRQHARATERSRNSALAEIQELAGIEGRHWKPRLARMMADRELMASGGQFYQDTRTPWLVADTAAVTLATTQKQLWSTADLTPTYASDWTQGKLFMIRAFGRLTTPAGAGALTLQLGYGTADGTGGALATSAALTVVASQTNISWRFEGRVRCRAVGPGAAAGILLGTGIFETGTAVQAQGGGMVPATAPAQVGSLNLNQTSGIHLQMAEAATTGGTVTIHDLELVAEN